MTYHYIYHIDRPTTGEWYVGIRSCECWPTEDVTYLGSGRLIKAKIKKHGRDTFDKTILAIVETRQEAARIEAALVGPAQVADRLCMNLCEGGDCGSPGRVLSKDSIEKIRKGALGNTAHLGCTHSPETKAKISLAKKGQRPWLGRKHSDAARAKMKGCQNAKGNQHSDAAKARMSASWTPERRATQAARRRKQS